MFKFSRYLIVGFINTLFGYFNMIYLYTQLSYHYSTLLISVVSGIISITFSYLSYKIFVFKTKGDWISEYLKVYIVYGFTFIIGIVLTIIMIDNLGISVWVTQGIIILIGILVSYLGHLKFTFIKKN